VDFSKVSEWIGKATATSLLAGAIVTNLMGYWVTGVQYKAVVAERDEWKGIALKAVHVGEAAVTPHLMGSMPASAPPAGDIDSVRRRVAELEEKAK
jgi:hypothetical protein